VPRPVNVSNPALFSRAPFRYHDCFPCFFSVVRRMPEYIMQSRCTPPPQARRLHQCLNSRTFPDCDCASRLKTHPFQNVFPCQVRCCLSTSLVGPSHGIQPRCKINSVSIIPNCIIKCLLLSKALQSNTGVAKQTETSTCASPNSPPLALRLALGLWFGNTSA
jgi:hypothetical protein